MLRTGETPAPAVSRVVLLGASNLTRGFSTVLETTRAMLGAPLDILAAIGHGRTYGTWSRVLGRGLPGIARCGLWSALRSRPPAPAYAVLTDVGNEIPHDVPVDEILGHVAACLDALAAVRAKTVVTLLPEASLEKLGSIRYYAVRALLFPNSRLPLGQALERVREVSCRLRELAASRGALVVELDERWYGFDSIHIRLRHWSEAWREILAPWRGEQVSRVPLATGSLARWVALRRLRPHEWSLFGIARRSTQPCGVMRDGTTLSLY
jgi:hypothetical protein